MGRAVEAAVSAGLLSAIWKMLFLDPRCHDDFDLDSLQLEQFVELLVAARPWARFVHYQQHVAAFLVDREQVNYGGIGNTDLRFCHASVTGLNAIDFAR